MIRWLQTDSFGRRLIAGEVSADEYRGFLVQTYHYVRWTSPLLRAAAQRLSRDRPLLAQIYLAKIEENGHDAWILRDLRYLGTSAAEVVSSTPPRGVESYVAWNRMVAEAGQPVGLLGTAYVMERVGEELAGRVARNLVAHSGIQGIEQAVSFLEGHAAVDAGHVEDVAAAVDEFVRPDEEEIVVLSAQLTALSYRDLASPRSSSLQLDLNGADL
jgi:pyrroloquinoline quinone (PQQ) biosynthesis protein C